MSMDTAHGTRTVLNKDAEREKFEKFVRERFPASPLTRHPFDPERYDGVLAAWTWEAWQARAGIAGAQPSDLPWRLMSDTIIKQVGDELAPQRVLKAGAIVHLAADGVLGTPETKGGA